MDIKLEKQLMAKAKDAEEAAGDPHSQRPGRDAADP